MMRGKTAEILCRRGLSRYVGKVIEREQRWRQVKLAVMFVLTVLLFILYASTSSETCDEEDRLSEDQRRLVEMIDRVCGDRILLILNMFPAARSGWGFLAMNIFVRLSNEGRFCPVLTDKPEGEAF